MTRVERFGDRATLVLGDCREVLPTLARPAAIVSDPPYGQRLNTNVVGKGGSRNYTCPKGKVYSATRWPPEIFGDDQPFDPTWLLSLASIVLLWGAHRFGHRLPEGTLLIWDKVPTGKVRSQGDGEAAWLNSVPPRPLRIFRYLWDGLCVARREAVGSPHNTKRLHPTQKPEDLMAWCIAEARIPAGGMIYDPYMGAGSTGVAAFRMRHPFIGIEIEPLYFDTACRRIEAELKREAADG